MIVFFEEVITNEYLSITLVLLFFYILELLYAYHEDNGWSTILEEGVWLFLNEFITFLFNHSQEIIIRFLLLGTIYTFTNDSQSFHIISHYSPIVQFFLIITIEDFLEYWFHRAEHHFNFLKRIHIFHHATERVTLLSGFRVHPIENILGSTLISFMLILLGADLKVLIYSSFFSLIYGVFVHSNIRFFWPTVIRYFLVDPQFHRVHHTKDGVHSNYANVFSFYDSIFVTANLTTEKILLSEYGVNDKSIPKTKLGKLLYFLKPKVKEIDPSDEGPILDN